MLNHLVRKHPGVAGICPMLIEDALSRRLFTAGQFEIVTILLERCAELADDTITALEPIASRGLVLAVGDDVELRRSGTVRDLRQPSEG